MLSQHFSTSYPPKTDLDVVFVIDTDEPLGPVPPERIDDDLEDGRRRHFPVTGAFRRGKLGQRSRNRKEHA